MGGRVKGNSYFAEVRDYGPDKRPKLRFADEWEDTCSKRAQPVGVKWTDSYLDWVHGSKSLRESQEDIASERQTGNRTAGSSFAFLENEVYSETYTQMPTTLSSSTDGELRN